MTIHTYPNIVQEEQLETPDYRPEIGDIYLINHLYLHCKTLKKRIGEEFHNNDLGKLIQFFAQPLEEAECKMIRLACCGAGTNESLLYPIIVG
eukprot:9129618-Ditylum_brightwellii.AAC.1